MYPTDADRERLLRDRAARLVDAIPDGAQRLVAEASSRPGVEIHGQLGPLRVRLIVVEVDALRELHVALAMRAADPDLLMLALVGLCPNPGELGAWRTEMSLPTGPLDPEAVELGFSCLLPT